MNLRTVIVPLLLTATFSSYGEINLTPMPSEYVANGSKIQQLHFNDGKRRIEYEPPNGWSVDGNANQVTLKPNQNFAQAAITVTTLNKPQPLDDVATKVFAEKLVAELPVGSQFAKIEEQTVNPVLVGGHDSVEVVVSYQLTGEKFVRSALVVNLNDEQLVFRLTAKKTDFSALHRDFKSSIFSWHWLEEKGQSPDPTKAVSASTVQEPNRDPVTQTATRNSDRSRRRNGDMTLFQKKSEGDKFIVASTAYAKQGASESRML